MIKWLKKLAASKIQINVTIHEPFDPKITRIDTPTVINYTGVSVNRVQKSNFRFVSDIKTDYTGKTSCYHYTEELRAGTWTFLSETGSSDKDTAIELHLKLIEKGTLAPTTKKVVNWEGLDKEETKSWASLQLNLKKEKA